MLTRRTLRLLPASPAGPPKERHEHRARPAAPGMPGAVPDVFPSPCSSAEGGLPGRFARARREGDALLAATGNAAMLVALF